MSAKPTKKTAATRPYSKTDQVLTTLRPEDRQRLDEVAERLVVSRAELVRRFVLAGLGDQERLDALPVKDDPRL